MRLGPQNSDIGKGHLDQIGIKIENHHQDRDKPRLDLLKIRNFDLKNSTNTHF